MIEIDFQKIFENSFISFDKIEFFDFLVLQYISYK